MIKSRTKIEAVISIAIITLLILPSIIGDVTITDTAITDDTNGIMVSFANDYIDITNLSVSDNVSIGNINLKEPSGALNGYWNGSSEYIMNSNGKTWLPTEDNLQSAIWDLNSTGGTIWLPHMNLSSSNISLDKNTLNITFIGVGSGSWLGLDDSGYGQTMFCLNKDDDPIFNLTGTGHYTNDVQSITFENIYFYGNGYSGEAIQCIYGADIIIENCVFRGFKSPAIDFGSVYKYKIRDNDFHSCGNVTNTNATIYIHTQDGNVNTAGEIKDNLFSRGKYSSINANTQSTCVDNNYFEGWTGDYSHSFITGTFVNSEIINNFMMRNDDYGTSFVAITISSYKVTISNNEIERAFKGIQVNSPVSGSSIISNNYLKNTSDNGIHVSNPGPDIISFNIIEEPAQNSDWPEAGIYLQDASNTTMIGNIITNSNEYGITIRGQDENISNVTALGNSILSESGTLSVGIKVTGDYHSVLVFNNVVENYSARGIQFDAGLNSTNSHMSNNILNNIYQFELPTVAPPNPEIGFCYLNATTGLIGRYREGGTWYWN